MRLNWTFIEILWELLPLIHKSFETFTSQISSTLGLNVKRFSYKKQEIMVLCTAKFYLWNTLPSKSRSSYRVRQEYWTSHLKNFHPPKMTQNDISFIFGGWKYLRWGVQYSWRTLYNVQMYIMQNFWLAMKLKLFTPNQEPLL